MTSTTRTSTGGSWRLFLLPVNRFAVPSRFTPANPGARANIGAVAALPSTLAGQRARRVLIGGNLPGSRADGRTASGRAYRAGKGWPVSYMASTHAAAVVADAVSPGCGLSTRSTSGSGLICRSVIQVGVGVSPGRLRGSACWAGKGRR